MSRDPDTAKRRLAFQKSYSLEHGTSWRRRSLIEDAKFDTVTNAEFEKQELTTQVEKPEVLDESEVIENGGVHVTSEEAAAQAQPFQFSIVVSLRDMKDFSRVFKALENTRITVHHVESRNALLKGGSHDFLLILESTQEALTSFAKTLRQNSAVCDVNVIKEKAVEEKEIWFPRHVSDLDRCTHLLTKFDPDLDYDHPGFADKDYRQRRKALTEAAFNYKHGQVIPHCEYTIDEIKTWGIVYRQLWSLYSTHACREHIRNLRMLERECGYSEHHIPQLEDVSNFLKRKTGFRLRPVAGLLSARDFLASLAFRVFQCTQYIRHPSKPDHTVEPDCVHELLGHAPLLADRSFAQFSQEIGLASLGASDGDIEKIATMYWFTVEFGLCKQDGQIRAYGAGLLSAFGELKHALSDVPERRPFDPVKTSVQSYQDQDYQPIYFVAESFEDVKQKLRQYTTSIQRPYQLHYDPYTETIQVLDNKDTIQDLLRVVGGDFNELQLAMSRLEAVSVA